MAAVTSIYYEGQFQARFHICELKKVWKAKNFSGIEEKLDCKVKQ